MDPALLDQWLPIAVQQTYVSLMVGRMGMTRRRAECFVRLWAYLCLKDRPQPAPLLELGSVMGWIICTHREAAALFYSGSDQGSERAAGMMLDKLQSLGLLSKRFDGNSTLIRMESLPVLASLSNQSQHSFVIQTFDPRTDAIPVATLLASNYNWMNRNTSAVPPRIARLLRAWSGQYPAGMRVLRRADNQHVVGFYLLYPTAPESEIAFFGLPQKVLHLAATGDVDPITMAQPGDPSCTAIYVRSFVIDAPYFNQACALFLTDTQQVLRQMQQDFPNLCDLYSMVIHPAYERLASALGFQKMVQTTTSAIYWMYLPLDRFLGLSVAQSLSQFEFQMTGKVAPLSVPE